MLGSISFNPRARVGRDLTLNTIGCLKFWFQSTRPRGARQFHSHPQAQALRRFNPRARVGRDSSESAKSSSPPRFQSTRPRGARLETAVKPIVIITFQSTRPRGARLLR